MLTCIPCFRTRGLITEITKQIKGVSLKTLRPRREKKPASPSGAIAEERKEAPEEKEKENEKDWVAEPEPGVLITLESLPDGGNNIKRIRFSQELFDAWGAKKWWSENYDKIMELYSIASSQSSPTPPQTEDEYPIDSAQALQVEDALPAPRNSGNSSDAWTHQSASETLEEGSETSAGAEGVAGKELEWVVEDEPGVFVTFRAAADGGPELLRVELSRERFGEVKARVWWEENKARLQKQCTQV